MIGDEIGDKSVKSELGTSGLNADYIMRFGIVQDCPGRCSAKFHPNKPFATHAGDETSQVGNLNKHDCFVLRWVILNALAFEAKKSTLRSEFRMMTWLLLLQRQTKNTSIEIAGPGNIIEVQLHSE